MLTSRVVLGHDLVELLGVLGRAQVAVVGDCVLQADHGHLFL